jgi:hypothetical protein
MKRLILALAITSALLTTGAFAQSVSDDVSKQLWCGTAFVVAFSTPPEGVTEDQLAEAKVYIDQGNGLIDKATQAHLDAGFTEEQVTTLKAALVTKVTEQISTSPDKADYKFEDCVALITPPAPAAAPAPDASSAPADASSSSAM